MNAFTDRDAFIATVLPGIVQGVFAAMPDAQHVYDKLDNVAHLSPEIAACARRIADAVMDERELRRAE